MVLLNTEVGYNVCGVTPPIQGNDKYVSAVVQSLDREKFFWHLQQKVTTRNPEETSKRQITSHTGH